MHLSYHYHNAKSVYSLIPTGPDQYWCIFLLGFRSFCALNQTLAGAGFTGAIMKTSGTH